jgi:tetratricopeptide (TPR) repeat protein
LLGIDLTRRRFLYPALAGLVIVWLGVNSGRIGGVVARNAGFLSLNRDYAGQALTGDLDDASIAHSIIAFRRTIDRGAGNASTWRALGYLHLARGEEEEALAAWRQAGIMTGELYAKGAEAEATANYDEALAWYGRVTTVDPQSIDAWLQAGSILELKGDWASAATTYSAGAASMPDNSDLLFRMAQVQRVSSSSIDWNIILDLLNRAIDKDNFLYDWHRAQSHHLRGEALRTLGNPKEALAEFIWVMEHRPDDYWATLGRAELTWQVEGDAEAAEHFFHAAVAIDAGNKWAYRQQAAFYADLGRIDEARTLYELVLRIDPDDQLAAEWLAQH